jgi:hypothetical protein
MDATIRREEIDDPNGGTVAPRDGARSGPDASGRQVRARLNGLPCLVAVTEDCGLTGQVAVAPVAGARAPLPPKGRRATLELVVSDTESADIGAVEPIEITVAAANPRSGRFTARVMTLSEEQERLLCAREAQSA